MLSLVDSMANARSSKASKATKSKDTGKRFREDDTSQEPSKRRRAGLRNAPFKFMDLPGEIRNRIYEYAAASAAATFPTDQFQNEKIGDGTRRYRIAVRKSEKLEMLEMLPFMALTQTSYQIRYEFYSMWLNTFCIPLSAIPTFFRVFMTSPRRSGKGSGIQRFVRGFDPRGTLKVCVRELDHHDLAIPHLLKHIDKYPDFTISLWSLQRFPEMEMLEVLLDNNQRRWLNCIRKDMLTSIRLLNDRIRLVVKEKYAPLWMRKSINVEVPDGFLESLGLDRFWVEFGINYT